MRLSSSQIQSFHQNGFVTAQGLFSELETGVLRNHFMDLRARGSYPGDMAGAEIDGEDRLKKYPRMIHMHRWDETSLRWLLDPRIDECLTALLGRETYAVQTMLYFKPPGARGQALHQDQFYLKTRPGTCAAAWMALDRCDEGNGCMMLVKGSHDLPALCTQAADVTQSFTDITVPIPADAEIVPAVMNPGDVLFFNGSVIHGSYPNQSKDRFRRALIGHYIAGEAEQVASYYHPALRMDGTEVELGVSEGGGPCGIWKEAGKKPAVEMAGAVSAAPAEHE